MLMVSVRVFPGNKSAVLWLLSIKLSPVLEKNLAIKKDRPGPKLVVMGR